MALAEAGGRRVLAVRLGPLQYGPKLTRYTELLRQKQQKAQKQSKRRLYMASVVGRGRSHVDHGRKFG